jgi:hypothetical protein
VPILLRYTDMSEAQRKAPLTDARLRSLRAIQQTRARHEGKDFDPDPDMPFDWRFAVWFLNNRKRPAENRDAVYLSEETPFEILTTIHVASGTDDMMGGIALVSQALHALRKNVLDSKAPLLVLCDWLEERDFAEAPILRAFTSRSQRWDRYCLSVGTGSEKGGIQSGPA